MSLSSTIRTIAAGLGLGLCSGAMLPAQAQPSGGPDLVWVETGSSNGITVRLVEDIASVADDGATRRVLPVVGHGGVQDVIDLTQLPGIDMAILQLDVLQQAEAQIPGLRNQISYVARMNYAEFHLLTRDTTNNIAELNGQTVSVGAENGNTAVTAAKLFGLLKLSPSLVNDAPDIALAKLRRNEIGAVAFVGGKPVPLLLQEKTEGLHLLAIPLTPAVINTYVPTKLDAAAYPGLIVPDSQLDTVAVATGLFVGALAPESDAYRKVSNLVDTLFTQFQTLLAPGHHPKWTEVNLSSEIPGWHRFPAADAWLRRNNSIAAGQDLRAIFMRFLDERQQAGGEQQMSQQQKDELFDQFRRWQNSQSR